MLSMCGSSTKYPKPKELRHQLSPSFTESGKMKEKLVRCSRYVGYLAHLSIKIDFQGVFF